MEAILEGIKDVVALMPTVFTAMTGNALLTFFLSVSVLGVGIGLFKRMRRAAH